jgi:protein SCO1/2
MRQFFLRSIATAALCGAAVVCAPGRAAAQPMMPAGGTSPEANSGGGGLAPSEVLQSVGVDQNLDAQISPDLTFKNERGETVRLGDYMGKRPLLLTLVYYKCPGLCTMTLNGVVTSLRPLAFTPGNEYDVLTVSFDPRETPELAAEKKQRYVKDFLRKGSTTSHDAATTERGWHFLTGDEANVKALCETVGFRYRFDEHTQQYAHASAIIIVTPQGRVSRYFYGLEYSSKDLRLGVVEAADERIGTVSDAVTLLCYKYDPASGRYSLRVMRVLQVAAVATLATLGTFMFVMFRRDRRGPATPA